MFNSPLSWFHCTFANDDSLVLLQPFQHCDHASFFAPPSYLLAQIEVRYFFTPALAVTASKSLTFEVKIFRL